MKWCRAKLPLHTHFQPIWMIYSMSSSLTRGMDALRHYWTNSKKIILTSKHKLFGWKNLTDFLNLSVTLKTTEKGTAKTVHCRPTISNRFDWWSEPVFCLVFVTQTSIFFITYAKTIWEKPVRFSFYWWKYASNHQKLP